ncbi:MAG: helix-hairpin-helix domain-containing protein [Planctomycetia bacterium]|nr:helix-hairpin-helix domain-containing protein [Planctomycetia bacterium]
MSPTASKKHETDPLPRMTLSPVEQRAVLYFFVVVGLFCLLPFAFMSRHTTEELESRNRAVSEEKVPIERQQKDDFFEEGFLVDINNASEAELRVLPGVGEITAQKIVQDRNTYGPFRTIEELDRVPGIGPKKLEKMRAHILPILSSENVAHTPASPSTSEISL